MEVEIDGVINETPLPTDDPPVEVVNQLIVPTDAVAPSVTEPVPQLLPGVVAVIVGIVVIVAVTELLVGVVQPFAVASTK